MTNVRVGAIVFWGGAGNDGFYIEGEGLQGLTGGVDVKRDAVPREQNHGDFDVPGYREPRLVSIAGPCEAVSAEKLAHYGRQFTGLLADGGTGQVVFDTPGGPLWGAARLGQGPTFDITLWGQRAHYSLSLWFPNPRLYGETNTFGPATSVVANHYGNFAAAPVLTVAGSMPSGYTIAGPGGRTFTVTRAVTAGHPHVIDMATGYLRVDGVIVYGVVTSGDTWAVPAGVQVSQTLVPVSGSGTLAVVVEDTFI